MGAHAHHATPDEAAKTLLDTFDGDRIAAVDFVASEALEATSEAAKAFWSKVAERLLQNLDRGETAFLSTGQMQQLRDELGEGPWNIYRVRHMWPEVDFHAAGQRMTQEDLRAAYRWMVRAPRHAKPLKEKHRVFYLGTHRSSWLDEKACAEVPDEMVASWVASAGIPLFISRRQLEKRRKLPRARARWALDSGGFTELTKFGGWELSPKEYIALVRRFRDEIGLLDWAAPMDWMCEVEQLQRTGLSVPQHVERTVQNFLELRERAPDLPIIPVLQGLRMEDYAVCMRLYEKAGVDLTKEKVVGLGSVCRRQSDDEVVEFAAEMSKLGVRLHGFGFKIEGLKKAQDFFVSADSMAWSYGARRNQGHCPEGKNTCANCLHEALAWREKLLSNLGKEWAFPWR